MNCCNNFQVSQRLALNNNNNNVYFKLVYRLNDNKVCTSYGHGIKAVIYYIFTITGTSLRTV